MQLAGQLLRIPGSCSGVHEGGATRARQCWALGMLQAGGSAAAHGHPGPKLLLLVMLQLGLQDGKGACASTSSSAALNVPGMPCKPSHNRSPATAARH